MATGKVIKLTNNNGTPLLPITDSAYVQHKWKEGATGGTTITSVQDALNNVIDRVDALDTTDDDHAFHKVSGTSGKMNDTSSTAVSNPYINVHHNTTVTSGASPIQLKGSSSSGAGSASVSVSGVPNTGVITITASYTDTNNKVDVDNKNTSKLYITGAANAGNITLSYDSNVYLETTAGHLHATQFKGDLNGTINTATTATTQASTDDSTKVATTAFVHDVIDGAMGDLAGALIYKGTIGASSQTYTASTLPTAASTNTGWVVVVANGANQFEFPANSGKYLETGDYIISNGSSWQAVTGENQVENKNATIVVPATGTSSAITIATVDGTDIKFTYAHGTPSGGTAATATASGSGTATTITTTSYIPVVSGISITKDANGHVTAVGVTTKGLNMSYTTTAKGFFGAKSGTEVPRYIGPNATNSSAGTGGNTSKFIQGTNITLTSDTTNNTLTIASKDESTTLDGHYTPTGTATNATLDANSVTASTTTTSLTHGTSVVLTGVKFKKDSKGHITELSYSLGKLPAATTVTHQDHAFINKTEAATGDYELKLSKGSSGSGSSVYFTPSHGVKLTASGTNKLTIGGTSVNVVKTVSYTSGMYAVIGKDADINDTWLTNALGTTSGTTYMVNGVTSTNESVWDYT